MSLILDLHLTDRSVVPATGQILFSASHFKSRMGNNQFASLDPGTTSTVHIRPRLASVSEDFATLAPETQKCAFEDRRASPTSVLMGYSKDNCQYECLALSLANNFSCVPWDMPFVAEGKELCNGMETKLFKDTFERLDGSLLCHQCLEDCSETSYHTKFDTFRSNWMSVCTNAENFGSIVHESGIYSFRNRHSERLRYLQGRTVVSG